MSRVDEARRRAAGRANGDGAFSNVSGVVSVDDYGLHDYPGEHVGLLPQPQAKVQRPISAPRSTGLGHLGSLDPHLNGRLVGSPDTPPVVIEQYRRVASSLHELQVDN